MLSLSLVWTDIVSKFIKLPGQDKNYINIEKHVGSLGSDLQENWNTHLNLMVVM